MHGLKQAFNHRILLVFLAETDFHNWRSESRQGHETSRPCRTESLPFSSVRRPSATLEGNEVPQRIRQGRSERFERVSCRSVKPCSLGCSGVYKGQQRLHCLVNVVQAQCPFIPVVVRRSHVLGHSLNAGDRRNRATI